MKILITLFLLLAGSVAQAQTSLVGRVYHNSNVIAGKMNNITRDMNKELDKAKADAIMKAEEKKKRKLTAAEKADLEKKTEEGMKMAEAILKGTKTAVTVTFKDEKTLVLNMDMKVDDEAMKKAGIGWAKRKMIQAACAITPSEKAKYIVKDNMIITEEGNEKDTMFLSDDGKYLTGKIDEDMTFKLTRTK